MRAAAIALLLILATVFRLAAGPHPCTEEQPPAQEAQTAHAACHGDAGPASPQGSRQEEDHKKADRTICQKACQALAVLHDSPALAVSRLSRELPAVSAERAVPLFVLSIDHIPLA